MGCSKQFVTYPARVSHVLRNLISSVAVCLLKGLGIGTYGLGLGLGLEC